jgi:hypothetical protein
VLASRAERWRARALITFDLRILIEVKYAHDGDFKERGKPLVEDRVG